MLSKELVECIQRVKQLMGVNMGFSLKDSVRVALREFPTIEKQELLDNLHHDTN